MKKTLLILCALLLTAIGANAQEATEPTAYTFKNTDWVGVSDRSASEGQVTYSSDGTNTITVTSTGANNIALQNSSTAAWNDPTNGVTPCTITAAQKYFVVIGSGLAIGETSETRSSYLWWMNGGNDAFSYEPTAIEELGDEIMFVWDLDLCGSTIKEKMTPEEGEETVTIDGWICFGLSASNQTTGVATISYIGFYTEEELDAKTTGEGYIHACEANRSDWTITRAEGETDGDFHLNNWSTEADASNMKAPFLEYWVWVNDVVATLSAATISHKTLTDLTPGVYEVSMDIRIMDDNENVDASSVIGEGTKFIANGVSEDLLTGSDATDGTYNEHEDLYGTYTLTCVVDDNGTLDISLVIPEDAAYDWISFKNLKVKLLDEPSLSWEMTSAGWGTLILPFDAAIPEATDTGDEAALTLYAGDALTLGTTDEDGNTALTLGDAAESIVANTPYLVSGTAGKYTFTGTYVEAENGLSDENGMLTGTFVDMNCDALLAAAGESNTVYVLQKHSGDESPAFYPVVAPDESGNENSKDTTLEPYHCYLTLSSASGVKAYISFPNSDGEATAIEAIEAVEGAEAETNGAIYDLSGRKVSKAVKGVYIQNGKKVLVK